MNTTTPSAEALSERHHREWIAMREEIWESRENADIAQRYFAARVDAFRRRENGVNVFSLIAQTAVVGVVLAETRGLLVVSLIAAVVTVLGVTQRWGDRREKHQSACKNANDSHSVWAALWREIDAAPPTRARIASLRKEIEAAFRNDRQNLHDVGERVHARTWVKMEKQVLAALPAGARAVANEMPSRALSGARDEEKKGT